MDDIDATTSRCETAPAVSGKSAAKKFILECEMQQLDGLPLGPSIPIRVTGLLRDGSLFEGEDRVRVNR